MSSEALEDGTPDLRILAPGRRGQDGKRHRRTLATAFDVAGLGSIADARRAFEIALFDTLGLENSPARDRLLVGIAEVATRLLEVEREQALDLLLTEDD